MLLNLATMILMNEAGEGDGAGEGGGEPATPAAPAAEPAAAAAPASKDGGVPPIETEGGGAGLKPIAAHAAKVRAKKAAAAAGSASSGTPSTPVVPAAATPGAKATPPTLVPPVAAAPAAAAVPEFKPNLTYKVKGQEKKFPDWVNPEVVKDAAAEAAIRETFEKSDGFDVVKADRDQARQQITEHFAPMADALGVATHFLQTKDLTSFFEVCNVDPRDVVKWSINYAQMTDDAKAADAVRRNEQYQAYVGSQQQDSGQSALQNSLVASRQRELNLVLSQPEKATAVAAFDQRFNKPGRFVQEVVDRGAAYALKGFDVPVDQLVSEVLALAGLVPGQVPTPAPVTPAAAGPAAAPTVPAAAGPAAAPQPAPAPAAGQPRVRPPVIPNIQGSGGSPVKNVIKTRSALLAKRDELRAQGR